MIKLQHAEMKTWFEFIFCLHRTRLRAWVLSQSVTSDSLWLNGLYPTRLLCLWDFPGKNTWVVCHFLHQGVFLIKGLNPCPLHWRWIVYHWATREVPYPHCMCMLHILFCAKIKLSSSYAMKKWTNSHHLAYFSFLVPTATPCPRRQWHPNPVLLPGKSHGRRSLVGCSPFGIENFRKLINN